MDNKFNEIFPSFDPLNKEFFPGLHLIDLFPSCFSFHSFNKCSNNNLEDISHQLDDIAIMLLLNHLHTLVIPDTGIKNNVATSIAHIHVVIRRVCGQTLGLGLVDRNRIVVIISLQQRKST